MLQATVTVSPVTPLIDIAAEWSELATDVAVHEFAAQAVTVIAPSLAAQVATPPPLYPVLQAM